MRKYLLVTFLIELVYGQSTIAVFNLENDNMEKTQIKAITTRLESEIVKIGNYRVVERNKLNKIAQEQEFQYSGMVKDKAVEIGALVGANYILIGSITEFEKLITISTKLVDVNNGAVIISADYDGNSLGDILQYGTKKLSKKLSGVENLLQSEVFQNSNYEGKSITINKEIINFSKTFNDKISSIKVSYGTQVVLYEHGNFKGKKIIVTRDLPKLSVISMNDKISSLQIQDYNIDADAIVVYENSNFKGKYFNLPIEGVFNLKKQSWLNDKISSIRIKEGYKCTIFTDSDFSGKEYSINNSIDNLSNIGFNDKISSISIK